MAGTKQPSDKSHFILPDLGEGVHEAELIKWRVKPGEKVDEHQTLAEMETDKALVEVPSPWAGVIRELHGKEGDIINVGATLVSYDIGAKGQAAPERNSQAAAERSVAADTGGKDARAHKKPDAARPAATVKQIEPKARREMQEDAVPAQREDAGTVVGSVGGSLAIPDRFARKSRTASDATNSAGRSAKALATPAVRRIAREQGIDINQVPPSGRGGRVTASDVESFANGAPASGSPALRAERTETARRPTAGGDGVRREERVPARRAGVTAPTEDQHIPFRGVRRKIAQALSHSVHTAVHFTVVDEADVTALDRKRREYARVLGRRLSLLPFVMTAVCRALRRHPALNANVDDEGEEIIIRSAINLGCAVDTEHGLMVPVIARADSLSVVQLSDAVSQLAAQCRDRTVPRENLLGGTFTISNVGSYGGMFATPIINYPEVGILAAGRAAERVLVKNGAFYSGLILPLSLSCDHRVVDGAEGARFLNTVVKLLEKPEEMLE